MTMTDERRAQADDVIERVIAASAVAASAAAGVSFDAAVAQHFAILRDQWPLVWALACERLREDDAVEMLALAGGTVCDD